MCETRSRVGVPLVLVEIGGIRTVIEEARKAFCERRVILRSPMTTSLSLSLAWALYVMVTWTRNVPSHASLSMCILHFYYELVTFCLLRMSGLLSISNDRERVFRGC